MPATLTINGQSAAADPKVPLFDLAASIGIPVPTSCRKQGKCKECIVEISEGMESLTARTEAERHLRGNFRLSCQAAIEGNGPVRCHTMRRGHMRIERHAIGLPAHAGGRPDPTVTRDGDRILIDGEEVERSSGSSIGPIHGIAMDLGTTTVVLRLIDLETGECIADASFENPQRFGGSDVMARIGYDGEHRGLMMRTLAGYLTHAIEDFPVDPLTIYEMVVAGNSTMRDLFFWQSVHSIGQTPYRSITEIEMQEGRRATTALTSTGRRSLLPIHPRARVYGLPIISGHVGADAAACMLAIDLAHEERLVAIMDIGTNTELILGNRHRIVAASCPAGPAFEGGAISCGMPALEGAIERVAIDRDGAFHLGVVGDRAPQGICGSGLVDLMSELLRTGRMNSMGRFADDESRIELPGGIAFLESDVNELAQAKAANVAGLQVVIDNFGLGFGQIEVFYLGGAFGRHMSIEAAQRIGLIPRIAESRIVQVGNAAIEGASIALLSGSRRAELERMVRMVEHCRLETHPDFFDFFVEGCQFKPVEAAKGAAG
uniref:Ferredoxin n=1 Tax=Solibacter usitatus (strain Ellin6076) TaxID=234267 RepID=Q024B6_SOLUE